MGVDIWCAEIILDLKQKYNDIELYCIIPFQNQAEKWKNEYKLINNNILKNCNQKILLQKYFTSDYYIKRNKFLVEKSSVINMMKNII